MRRHIGLVAITAAIVLTPCLAHARGYGKGGVVQSPFGSYDTSSPEWKASGGNMMVYQQLMEQKMMMLQQQQMMKLQQQQQQYMKKQGKTPTPNPTPTLNAPVAATAKKKKKRTYDPTHPVTSGTHLKTDAAKAENAKPVKAATTTTPKTTAAGPAATRP